MKKISLIAALALSAMVSSGAFAQYANTSSTANIGVASSSSGKAQTIGVGTSFSGASSFQSSSFTSTPVATAGYANPAAVSLTGSVTTQGSSLAFNASSGQGTGSASANGWSNANISGNVSLPEAHGVGTGAAGASNSNFASVGVNDAQSNASLTSAQFTTSLGQTATYSAPYAGSNGLSTITDTASTGGSAYTTNESATGQQALTAAGVTLSNIPNVNNISTGYLNDPSTGNGATNTAGNQVTSNASFWGNASANNVSTQTFQAPTAQ
jgi:hypothetical protein